MKIMIDYGRQTDLEDLAEGIKNARNVAEREYLEKIMYRIVNQSTEVSSLRNELIGAMRIKDVNKIKRIQLHLQALKLEETRGASWGQNKAEKRIIDG